MNARRFQALFNLRLAPPTLIWLAEQRLTYLYFNWLNTDTCSAVSFLLLIKHHKLQTLHGRPKHRGDYRQMTDANRRGIIQGSTATINWSKNWCSFNWRVVRGQVRNYERSRCRCWKSRQRQVVSSGCCALLLLVASHVEKWRGALRVVCAWLIRTQRGKYVHTVTG